MSDVIDLDILRPKPKAVKLGSKQIDVSFIPSGITFDADRLIKELSGFDEEEVQEDLVKGEEAFEKSLELCALFLSVQHPELDIDWLKKHTDVIQIRTLVDTLKETLIASYAGAEEYGKK